MNLQLALPTSVHVVLSSFLTDSCGQLKSVFSLCMLFHIFKQTYNMQTYMSLIIRLACIMSSWKKHEQAPLSVCTLNGKLFACLPAGLPPCLSVQYICTYHVHPMCTHPTSLSSTANSSYIRSLAFLQKNASQRAHQIAFES